MAKRPAAKKQEAGGVRSAPWKELSWSDKLTKISAAALAVAAISTAAVSTKESWLSLFGYGASEPKPKIPSELTPQFQQDPVAPQPPTPTSASAQSMDLPAPPTQTESGSSVTRTRVEVRHTRSTSAGTETIHETRETISIRCAGGFTLSGNRCLPPPPEFHPCPGETQSSTSGQCPSGTTVPIIRTPPSAGPLIVFFDWDKADVSTAALDIVGRIALEYRDNPGLRIIITGHADRSGPDAYNLDLSQRRAENVRHLISIHGVPEPVVVTEAFGESRPLVETADGVREPQNRRAEITFGPGSE